LHQDEVLGVGNFEQQADKLVELNIHEQLRNLMKTKIIQKAWIEEKRPTLHGWVYGVKDGLLKSLYKIDPGTPLHEIYQYEF
jgi:carbonic anhydrase